MAVNESDQEETGSAIEFIETGSEMAGAAVGATLGLIAGPMGIAAGAVGGVAATRVLRHLGAELHRRHLGPREQVRTAAALAYAGAYVSERLEAGEQPRADGFFDGDDGARSGAEELLEGVLIEAGRSYEERKVQYLGRLYGAIAFEPRISAAYGHFLVRLMERLTYRQLAAMAFLMDRRSGPAIASLDVARDEDGSRATDDMIAELDELGRTGVIGIGQAGGSIAPLTNVLGAGSFRELDLGKAALTPVGADLYELAGLNAIREQDQAEVLKQLQGGWRTGTS